ncbi:MAG: FAD:protein FMN transferase [Ruthenibacterium sp.]
MRACSFRRLAAAVCAAAVCAGLAGCAAGGPASRTDFFMSTLVTQQAYGPRAEDALAQAADTLREWEARLSLYEEDSDICRINAAAGTQPVQVSEATAALLAQAKALAQTTDGAFALTVAPITLAWGVHSGAPRVVPPEECAALAALVDDSALQLTQNTAFLSKEGQGLDLGGCAKGAALDAVAGVYEKAGVQSAVVSLGGNVYARGTKPGGRPWRVGFRDPSKGDDASLASIELTDAVMAVSGDYERYFEQDGVRYGHIMDPAAGAPAQSDIVSVGVVCATGLEADIRSTELFVRGKAAALRYFEAGGTGMMLCGDGVLYVSRSLQSGFELAPGVQAEVQFVG